MVKKKRRQKITNNITIIKLKGLYTKRKTQKGALIVLHYTRRYKKHREEVSAATHIKVRLYFHHSEQWHFSFDICLPSSPQHCPCSKMIEPRQRSGFYHKLVFHPPWLKCKIPLWSLNARPKKSLRKEKREAEMHNTNCRSLSPCRNSPLSRITVCAALFSGGDLLTRKKKAH